MRRDRHIAQMHGGRGPTEPCSLSDARLHARERARLEGSAEVVTHGRGGLVVHEVVTPDGPPQLALRLRLTVQRGRNE